MQSNLRKITVSLFMIVSTLLISYMAYTAYLYFGMFQAVRIFNVSLKSFDVNISNNTGNITTGITLSNPSDYAFNINQINQILYWNREYFNQSLWRTSAIKISPQETTDLSDTARIPEQKINLIQGAIQKNWIAQIVIELNGPLVGDFELSFIFYPE